MRRSRGGGRGLFQKRVALRPHHAKKFRPRIIHETHTKMKLIFLAIISSQSFCKDIFTLPIDFRFVSHIDSILATQLYNIHMYEPFILCVVLPFPLCFNLLPFLFNVSFHLLRNKGASSESKTIPLFFVYFFLFYVF